MLNGRITKKNGTILSKVTVLTLLALVAITNDTDIANNRPSVIELERILVVKDRN